MARTNFETSEGLGNWAPTCDVYETADRAVVLCLELPGLEQDQIDLRIDGDDLIVEGERKLDREQAGEQHHRVERAYGSFSRRFNLPSNRRSWGGGGDLSQWRAGGRSFPTADKRSPGRSESRSD